MVRTRGLAGKLQRIGAWFPEAVQMNTLRVLVADDHPLVREAFESYLQRYDDIEVVASVADGRQAVDCCESKMPDLALLDYNMAGFNGSAAAAEIKRRFPQITVVGMSIAYDAEKGMSEAGADYFLDKTTVLHKLPVLLKDVQRQHAADGAESDASPPQGCHTRVGIGWDGGTQT